MMGCCLHVQKSTIKTSNFKLYTITTEKRVSAVLYSIVFPCWLDGKEVLAYRIFQKCASNFIFLIISLSSIEKVWADSGTDDNNVPVGAPSMQVSHICKWNHLIRVLHMTDI